MQVALYQNDLSSPSPCPGLVLRLLPDPTAPEGSHRWAVIFAYFFISFWSECRNCLLPGCDAGGFMPERSFVSVNSVLDWILRLCLHYIPCNYQCTRYPTTRSSQDRRYWRVLIGVRPDPKRFSNASCGRTIGEREDTSIVTVCHRAERLVACDKKFRRLPGNQQPSSYQDQSLTSLGCECHPSTMVQQKEGVLQMELSAPAVVLVAQP